MPIYRVKCDECGDESDIFRSIAEYDQLPIHCGIPVHRMVCAAMVRADIQPYRSMVTGQMIEGRAQHREYLRKNDLVEVGNEKLGHKKYEADHNVRPEMMEAIKQHLGR